LANLVQRDAFVFDEPVNNIEASYVADYTALTSRLEADTLPHPASSEKKIPLAITLLGMISVCGFAWTVAILVILRAVGH
jgi:hypothetical protein